MRRQAIFLAGVLLVATTAVSVVHGGHTLSGNHSNSGIEGTQVTVQAGYYYDESLDSLVDPEHISNLSLDVEEVVFVVDGEETVVEGNEVQLPTSERNGSKSPGTFPTVDFVSTQLTGERVNETRIAFDLVELNGDGELDGVTVSLEEGGKTVTDGRDLVADVGDTDIRKNNITHTIGYTLERKENDTYRLWAFARSWSG